MTRFRILAGLLVAIAALTLASCGGGGSTNPNTSGNANIRYVNGSPNVGGIDIYVNGKIVVTNLQYRGISPYQSTVVGTNPLPQVAFTKTGTQVNIFPATSGGAGQTFQLGAAPSENLTIVLEGEANVVGSTGLNLGAFVEPAITNSTGTWSVVWHHASPSAALAAPNGLDVGSFGPGTTLSYIRLGQVLFSTQTGSTLSFFGLQSQAAVNTSPGLGFYTAPTAATSTPSPAVTSSSSASPSPSPSPTPYLPPVIYAQIVPGPAPVAGSYFTNGVDPANSNNFLPFNSDSNLFIYIIDSQSTSSGVEMVGTFSN